MLTSVKSNLCLVALLLSSLTGLSLACAPSPSPQPKEAQPAAQPAGAAAQPAATSAPAQASVPATKASAPAKTELVIAQSADVTMLDPHMSTNVADLPVSLNIFDNLVTRGVDNKLKPALATEWKTINPTTWQFKIRQGVKFHNGEPLTADTVKFSLDRTIPSGDPKVMTRGSFTTVSKIEVVDQYTVNIITTDPDPLLPDRLSFSGGQIIPKAYFQQVGADAFNTKPVGTGPLKFVERIKDDRTVLEANKEWWGGKIAFERVIFRPIPEVAARVAALLKGEVDLVSQLPTDDLNRVNNNPTTTTVGARLAGLYVVMTDYKPPFPGDDKYFHEAMSLAIDRKSIVDNLWRGQGLVPNSIYPDSDWTYDPSLPPMEYNPAKAKQLLQQIGYKGQEISFFTAGTVANEKVLSEALVAMWKDVGINVKLQAIENSIRAAKIRDKNFGGMLIGEMTSTLMDPDGDIYRLTGPGATHDYLRIPEWDQLMKEARVSLDQAKRKADYDAANKIYMEYQQWIPVIQPVVSYGIQRSIDFTPRANGQIVIPEIRTK